MARTTRPRHDGGDQDRSGNLLSDAGQVETTDLTQDPDVDPAAGIDTEAEEAGRAVSTYATPWGLRPMSAAEAEDLRKQGLAITEEPDLEPDTSLEGERADLASLPVVVATEHRDASEDFDSD